MSAGGSGGGSGGELGERVGGGGKWGKEVEWVKELVWG